MSADARTYDAPLPVLIWCPDRRSADLLEDLVRRAGRHPVCCMDADKLLETALAQLPGCILAVHDPPLSDGIAMAAQLRTRFGCALLLASGRWDKPLAKAAATAGYDAFLSIPATASTMTLALLSAEEGYERICRMKETVAELEQRLADRKLIERAKGMVMMQKQLSEEQAFRTMRSESMRRRISMARLAEELIGAGSRGPGTG